MVLIQLEDRHEIIQLRSCHGGLVAGEHLEQHFQLVFFSVGLTYPPHKELQVLDTTHLLNGH